MGDMRSQLDFAILIAKSGKKTFRKRLESDVT